MVPVGQIGDQRLEVARDAADGRVLRRQLGLDARHLVGEPRRERLDGLVFRLLPEPLVPREDGIDRVEQSCFHCERQSERLPHPCL